MTASLALGVAALVAASAPPRTDRKPDWIDGDSGEWPREMYVLGVGIADDRGAAEDRARAEIGRVFSTRILSTTRASSSESNVRANGRTATEDAVSVAEETASTTDKLLEGVEIAQVWQHPATRQIYALAVLDRQQAAARFRAQLDALEARAVPLRAGLSSPEKARAVSAAVRLIRLGRQREALAGDLRIVAPSSRQDRDKVQEAEAEARQTLGRVSVGLSVEGDVDDVVKTGLAGALASLGLSVSKEARGADLIGEATLSLRDLGKRDGWYWARATLGVVLKDAASARVLVSLNESAREASRMEGEADRRVLGAVADKLRSSFPAALYGWADGP